MIKRQKLSYFGIKNDKIPSIQTEKPALCCTAVAVG